MKQLAVAAIVLLSFGCASTDDAPEPVTAPQPAPDPRIGELQTAMTELLERLDVMNSRLARIEEGAPATQRTAELVVEPVVREEPTREEPVVREEPVRETRTETIATARTPDAQTTVPQQRALVGAKLAEDYRQAIILVGRGRHTEARRAFQAVFDSDSSGDLADNALFWIGETYFAANDFNTAVRYYMRVVNEFSDQNKAPDALFKVALAQARTGDLALARRTLQQVIDRYPYSSTASSAKAEMQRIRY
jgi:tol-pal system protein YbgF